ncbi:unnamed protein product [Acanthoscelides obtectus]|uniref:Uncharacterized protein n=1 Tax=Acanthoscelides obtectus TaxID=200917 RepID=A0A9P0LG44_ACAOB|nr:unnamed protein product [Acanthoscelides obtectus]CAK1624398.1 hypothetical protein AOBTE_LOCUS2546 [Acanthoscelides obtectus]
MSNTFTLTGYTSKLSANFYPPIELDIKCGLWSGVDRLLFIQHEIISMNVTYKERYKYKVDEMFSLKALIL